MFDVKIHPLFCHPHYPPSFSSGQKVTFIIKGRLYISVKRNVLYECLSVLGPPS